MTVQRLHGEHDVAIEVFKDDLSDAWLSAAKDNGVIAWDIETSGLDWRHEQIGTCQLFTPLKPVAVVIINDTCPINLRQLLEDKAIKKVFHHALFDLRFMAHAWKATPRNIVCTKIASKLLNPHDENHSLQALVKRYFDISLDKTIARSDWLAADLTQEQICYAASDALHLLPLLDLLGKLLEKKGLLSLANECFSHIPTRVHLEILGYPDIYVY